MHADSPRQCDNELQPDPELTLTTPEPPLVDVLKELRRADLLSAITRIHQLVMQNRDVETVNSWELCVAYLQRQLASDITDKRQLDAARARRKRKITEEIWQEALGRAPEEARLRGVRITQKLVAKLIGVTSRRLRAWEAENGKSGTYGQRFRN